MNAGMPETMPWITRTTSEHFAFLWRNLTPRTMFANGIALLWVLAVGRLIRWFARFNSEHEQRKRHWIREQKLCHQNLHEATTARLSALGFIADATDTGSISLSTHAAPELAIERMIMVPHGKTPSNVNLLFQAHTEGPNATLLPESLNDAAEGVAEFLDTWGSRLRKTPSDFVFLRSPLHRTAQTAQVYKEAIAAAMPEHPPIEVEVDAGLLEINQGPTWHSKSVSQLQGSDRWVAQKYVWNPDLAPQPATAAVLLSSTPLLFLLAHWSVWRSGPTVGRYRRKGGSLFARPWTTRHSPLFTIHTT